ncbi:hypothetical protein GW17_00048715, partial [Ensete ventricosum]
TKTGVSDSRVVKALFVEVGFRSCLVSSQGCCYEIRIRLLNGSSGMLTHEEGGVDWTERQDEITYEKTNSNMMGELLAMLFVVGEERRAQLPSKDARDNTENKMKQLKSESKDSKAEK